MKYVISVSKTYKHRGNHRHKRAKKHWHVFYYDEEGSLHCEQVNWFQALYYKTQKRHRIKAICSECGRMYIILPKRMNDISKFECPYCDGFDV